jgi:hypothetical protein
VRKYKDIREQAVKEELEEKDSGEDAESGPKKKKK